MPIDFGQALQAGMAVVPDYAQVQARDMQIDAQRRAIALREQEMQQQAVQVQRQIEQEANWQRDLEGYLANPQTARARELMLRYPGQAENMRKTLEAQGADVARSNLRNMGEIHALASSNDFEGAAALLQRRIEADAASGQPADESDAEMVTLLRSQDPVQRNRALGTLRVGIAALAGPERFSEALGRMSGPEPTNTEQVADFIAREAGSDARQQYVASIYDPMTTVPLPGGRTYAGPRSGLSGAVGGQPQGGGDPASSGGVPSGGDAAAVMSRAVQTRTISREDVQRLSAQLGPNGVTAMRGWLAENNVQVVGGQSAPVRVSTVEQAQALAPGTRFIDPNGVERVR